MVKSIRLIVTKRLVVKVLLKANTTKFFTLKMAGARAACLRVKVGYPVRCDGLLHP